MEENNIVIKKVVTCAVCGSDEIKPVLEESTGTLIGLIDRIRMLDNDMIRLNTKIQMILQEQEQKEEERSRENRKRNRHILETKL